MASKATVDLVFFFLNVFINLKLHHFEILVIYC